MDQQTEKMWQIYYWSVNGKHRLMDISYSYGDMKRFIKYTLRGNKARIISIEKYAMKEEMVEFRGQLLPAILPTLEKVIYRSDE